MADDVVRRRRPRVFSGVVGVVCVDCEIAFEYPARSGPIRKRCDACTLIRKHQTDATKARRWRAADPDRAREQWTKENRKRALDPDHLQWKRDNELRRMYGLTRVQLDDMLEAQHNRCAVCGGERTGPGTRLHVDHCHVSGRVRGLLCSKCNTFIGLAGDDPDRLEAAARYLRGI